MFLQHKCDGDERAMQIGEAMACLETYYGHHSLPGPMSCLYPTHTNPCSQSLSWLSMKSSLT
jgi:hypothetical protein